MWNLARVSCVPDSVEVRGTVLVSEQDGRYAYGFMDKPQLAQKITETLCTAEGFTPEQIEEGEGNHFDLDVSRDFTIECQDRIIRGEMSVLQCNGTPLAYILTKSDSTAKLLTILNELRIDARYA